MPKYPVNNPGRTFLPTPKRDGSKCTDRWDVAQNVRRAEALGLEVARLGAMPLIPHANTHLFDGQQTDQFWIDGTLELLKRCDALVTTEDWTHSSGARGEVTYALDNAIPVFHCLDDLKVWLNVGATP